MTRKHAHFSALIKRLDELIDHFETHADPAVRDGMPELVESLRALHTVGLARLLTLLAEDRDRYDRALADPLIANLLLLHNLITVDERRVAEQVLQPFVGRAQAKGGDVRLVGVQDGIVRLRLLGPADGLRTAIEQALADGLPGFQRLEVEAASTCAAAALEHWPEVVADSGDGTASLLPAGKAQELEKSLQEAQASDPARARSHEPRPIRRVVVGRLDELALQTLCPSLVEGYPVLLVRDGAEVRAFRNVCPGSMLPLHAGSLQGGVINCRWHGCRFDAATGARVDGQPEPPLEQLLVTVEDEIVRVDLP